jgi:hypothetical protein
MNIIHDKEFTIEVRKFVIVNSIETQYIIKKEKELIRLIVISLKKTKK